eukprot:15142789-Ditylum_brightwellii.AAC.1
MENDFSCGKQPIGHCKDHQVTHPQQEERKRGVRERLRGGGKHLPLMMMDAGHFWWQHREERANQQHSH